MYITLADIIALLQLSHVILQRQIGGHKCKCCSQPPLQMLRFFCILYLSVCKSWDILGIVIRIITCAGKLKINFKDGSRHQTTHGILILLSNHFPNLYLWLPAISVHDCFGWIFAESSLKHPGGTIAGGGDVWCLDVDGLLWRCGCQTPNHPHVGCIRFSTSLLRDVFLVHDFWQR